MAEPIICRQRANMKILFISLGCDKNLVDTEEMLGLLQQRGYTFTDDENDCDIVVVNTCCFIGDAKEESINALLEAAELKKSGRVKALVAMGRIPAWVVIIIISREFIISGFRLVAADNRVVIAANYWGKFKTTFQMIMVCLMIVDLSRFLPWMGLLTDVIMWIALVLTVISLVDYLVKNKAVMKGQM